MVNLRRKPKGSGKIAQRVLGNLLDALSGKYPGIGIADSDFWFQKGDYAKTRWDLACWGADIPYRTEAGYKITIILHSYSKMTDCAKELYICSPGSDSLAHEYAVWAGKNSESH